MKLQLKCAWCSRWWDGENWTYDKPDNDYPVTHGMCEDCADDYLSKDNN